MEFGQRQNSSQRLYGLGGVVMLHALLIYALVNGLARKAIEVLPAPIETKILQEIAPPKEPPPPPPPTFKEPPPPYIPPPEVNIQQAPVERSNAITAVTTEKPVEAPPPAPVHQAVRVAPVIDVKKGCRQPDYPASSQRLGETGTVILQFLVGVDGRVKDSKLVTSSGHPQLDDAALDALSGCKFVPGTVDGKAEESWAPVKYTFKLN
jgi:protein TonB